MATSVPDTTCLFAVSSATSSPFCYVAPFHHASNAVLVHSGMAAVLAANIVIAAYAIVAIREDPVDSGIKPTRSKPEKVD